MKRSNSKNSIQLGDNMTQDESSQFKQIAKVVTQQVSELLGAQVCVVNDRNLIITSTDPALIGLSFDASTLSPIHVPFHLNGQSGEVIVTASDISEPISPRLTSVLVELVIGQAAAIARLPNQHELKNKFIHDLLRTSIADEAQVLREAQILGMDFTRPRAVILIDAADYLLSSQVKRYEALDTQSQRRVQLIIGSIVSFFHLPNDTICAYIGGSEIVVLKASSTQDLSAWSDRADLPSNQSWANLTALKRASTSLLNRLRCDTNSAISIGIGRYHPGIQGLARSYQDARAALSLGHRFHGQNQVHCLDNLGVAAFVGISDESTKIDLAKHLLTPLDQESELIETLKMFFAENCYPSSTANQLSI
ncbi:MAG: CdaR family transcriptional regulator, partial [Phormidesmis sp. CAN_BIN36]|nr:CdaR family transcriptional regulator [Phormidesmis sp. CAN_BIN36]